MLKFSLNITKKNSSLSYTFPKKCIVNTVALWHFQDIAVGCLIDCLDTVTFFCDFYIVNFACFTNERQIKMIFSGNQHDVTAAVHGDSFVLNM